MVWAYVFHVLRASWRGESVSLTMPRMGLKSDGPPSAGRRSVRPRRVPLGRYDGWQGKSTEPQFTPGFRLCDLMSRKGLAYLFPGFEPKRGSNAQYGAGKALH